MTTKKNHGNLKGPSEDHNLNSMMYLAISDHKQEGCFEFDDFKYLSVLPIGKVNELDRNDYETIKTYIP